jgi:hypothetical protein
MKRWVPIPMALSPLGHEIGLPDVIGGRMGPLWSHHVKAWALAPRANRLVVRYEKLAAGDEKTIRPSRASSAPLSTGPLMCPSPR